MTRRSPFRYFKTSPEIIRLAVMSYARFPLSLRNVEDLLHERGIEVSHETFRFWWNRFGPMLAAEMADAMRRVLGDTAEANRLALTNKAASMELPLSKVVEHHVDRLRRAMRTPDREVPQRV